MVSLPGFSVFNCLLFFYDFLVLGCLLLFLFLVILEGECGCFLWRPVDMRVGIPNLFYVYIEIEIHIYK